MSCLTMLHTVSAYQSLAKKWVLKPRCLAEGETSFEADIVPAANVAWFEAKKILIASVQDIYNVIHTHERMSNVALVKEAIASEADVNRLRRKCVAGVDTWTGENYTAGLVVVPRAWIVIDIDKAPRLPSIDYRDGAALATHARKMLPDAFKHASCVWQLSGSSGHPTKVDEIRLHLFFMLDAPVFPKAWKPFFANSGYVDLSIFDNCKLIFTAAPIIQTGVDPITQRHGMLQGEPVVIVPDEVKALSGRIAKGANEPKGLKPSAPKSPLPDLAVEFVGIISKTNILRSQHKAYDGNRARRLAFCAMLGATFGITAESALSDAFCKACIGDGDANGEKDLQQSLRWLQQPSTSGRTFSALTLLHDANKAAVQNSDIPLATRAARLMFRLRKLEPAQNDRVKLSAYFE